MSKIRSGGLGLDFGGSLLRACLVGRDGRVLRRARMTAPRLDDVPKIVRSIKRRWRVESLDGLVLGGTGIWTGAKKRELRAALRKTARRARVLSDVEMAHQAAFGAGPGILVVAGTGSIAFGRSPQGRTARAGGWGALLGDEGSAFWIGREALKDARLREKFPRPLTLAHGPAPVRRTAALARRVMKLAPKNRAASALLDRAAAHLAALAGGVKSELRWRGPIKVSWTGGLFRSRLFSEKFCRALKREIPSFEPSSSGIHPEEAAAKAALTPAIDSRASTR
ncbi:MAG TPA: BadF/BadG/BcrA/BcrD ATPase family protein [Elusimicrobiota bacterium]|nr:BadF/BadG/BcrA/BcrD ATPase family protein [Elusimicrobiota bacterium]